MARRSKPVERPVPLSEEARQRLTEDLIAINNLLRQCALENIEALEKREKHPQGAVNKRQEAKNKALLEGYRATLMKADRSLAMLKELNA